MTESNKDLSDALQPLTPAASVPVFNLVVYVAKVDSGFKARIANLQIDEATAGTPRDALSRIVTAAKVIVRENYASKSIPWIDPQHAKLPDEQQFMVPMHL